MSQNDMIIDNASGAAVRADINNALAALASTSKGNTAPGTLYAGQLWIDDNTPSGTVWSLNFFDGTDSIKILDIDTSANVVTPYVGGINIQLDPVFGTPKATTAATGDSSTVLATTAFVQAAGQYKTGSFTRDISLSSGNQSITGLGFRPKELLVVGGVNGTSAVSWGGGDGATNGCVYDNGPSTPDTYGVSTGSAIIVEVTASNIYTGTITFDADGFTIAWSKTGSPTGTGTFNYFARR